MENISPKPENISCRVSNPTVGGIAVVRKDLTGDEDSTIMGEWGEPTNDLGLDSRHSESDSVNFLEFRRSSWGQSAHSKMFRACSPLIKCARSLRFFADSTVASQRSPATVGMNSFLIPTLQFPQRTEEAEFLAALNQKIAMAPSFYANMPVILDAGKIQLLLTPANPIETPADIKKLMTKLKKLGLIPVSLKPLAPLTHRSAFSSLPTLQRKSRPSCTIRIFLLLRATALRYATLNPTKE